MSSLRATLQTVCALIHRDMSVFKFSIINTMINAVIWRMTVLLVFQYVMVNVGLHNYGAFIAVCDVASWGFWGLMQNISRFVGDLEGNQSITYYMTLPIPQWAVFARIALSNALQSMCISIFFLPIARCFLGSSLSFEYTNIPKFFVIFFLVNIFYGFFWFVYGKQA